RSPPPPTERGYRCAQAAQRSCHAREGPMHQLARAGIATFLLISVLTQPVAAAAGRPSNAYVASGAVSFVDRGVEWSGFVQIVDDRLDARQLVSVSFARVGAERICDPGTPD